MAHLGQLTPSSARRAANYDFETEPEMVKLSAMRILLVTLMSVNAALFFFGSLQHAGVSIAGFHEPRIIPAAVVEAVCGAFLICGAVAVMANSTAQWRSALIGNYVALAGVVLGMLALASGRGPRTASNDLYHRLMLLLIGASLVTLFLARPAKSGG